MFGQDPNWGRVVAAVGTTRAAFEPDRIDVFFNGVQVCRSRRRRRGPGTPSTSPVARCSVLVDLHAGPAEATVWTNDLTYGYVHENAEYST